VTTLITGANTGIGLATASELAAQGQRLYLACRSREKGEAAAATIRQQTGNSDIHFIELDLGSLASVRACASSFLELDEPLNLLINNAGVGGASGVTYDGFEAHFGINHLGHFLLTTLLLDQIESNAPARIVTVASVGHYNAKRIDWDALRRPRRGLTGLPAYAVTKLCNVLFTQELARRLDGTGVTTYSLHPGAVASDIWRRVPWPLRPLLTSMMISNEQGARTSVYCATSPEVANQSGLYYDKCAPKPASKVATPELAAELWRRSEEWVAA
jgi:retinol dehydrogenase-12